MHNPWIHWILRTVTVLLAVWPVAWLYGSAASRAPDSVPELLGLAGGVAGVFGLAWLLLAMILSIRVPGFDLAFGGLLRLWRIHHRLGAVSFLLLLVHPPLLALGAVPDGPAVVLAVLTPPLPAWPVWAGWAALLAMMVFLAPSFSFFGAPDYQRWKTLHRLSAAAVVLGVLHAVPLSRMPDPTATLWLWGGLGAAAMAAFVWRLGLSRILARKRYVISHVHRPAPRVVELTLEGPALDFRPGQFVYLAPEDPALPAGRNEEHPYAIVSAPDEPVVRIAIKNLGDASAALMDVSVGSTVTLEGPYGEFLPERHHRPALWIGGGIGLTPFVSAARAFADRDGAVDVALLYCANDPSRAYYLEELEDIAREQPGFTVHPHFFAERGPLDVDYLRERVPDFAARHAYVCGPPPLLDLAERMLQDNGVPRNRITTEEFDLL